MVHYKRMFFTAVLVLSAGSLWADDMTPTMTVETTPATIEATPTAQATVVKRVKAENPTVTAMKAAIALADAGKMDEAIAAFEQMGVLKSKSMETWRLNNEALVYLQEATPVPDKAVPLLEKAVATNDANYVAWNNLGSAYEQTGQIEKARDAYQKSIDLAKAANASSAKAEGNLQALQPKLDQLQAEKPTEATGNSPSADAMGNSPSATAAQ